MLTLADIALLLVLLSVLAWLWHGHGIREQALHLAKAHCAKLNLELLDGNVAFNRYLLLTDGQGKRRFARRFAFEFTVTGEQRLSGYVCLFGKRLAAVELDAHPFPEPDAPLAPKVIDLQEWRQQHSERH